MPTIIGLAGSVRNKSFNAALLRAAAELAPEAIKVEIASIAEIPLYNGDVEAGSGVPAPVSELKERIAAADGVLLVTPEYNHGIPGVFKNAIDWLSRPAADVPRVFKGRPVGIIGASPGRGGTRFSQTAWLPVIAALGMRPFFGKSIYIAGAEKLFDDERRLIDEKTRQLVEGYMRAFAEFIAPPK